MTKEEMQELKELSKGKTMVRVIKDGKETLVDFSLITDLAEQSSKDRAALISERKKMEKVLENINSALKKFAEGVNGK